MVKIAKGLGPIVQTGAGWLLLREVQLAGKRPQSGADLVNGTRLAVGETFGVMGVQLNTVLTESPTFDGSEPPHCGKDSDTD